MTIWCSANTTHEQALHKRCVPNVPDLQNVAAQLLDSSINELIKNHHSAQAIDQHHVSDHNWTVRCVAYPLMNRKYLKPVFKRSIFIIIYLAINYLWIFFLVFFLKILTVLSERSVHKFEHTVWPPVKFLACRNGISGPLSGNDAGNISPVRILTPTP